MSEKRKGAIYCSHEGKWKDELEERLQTEGKVTLLAIGRVRYKLLAYLQRRKDVEIVKVEFPEHIEKLLKEMSKQPQAETEKRESLT